MNIEYIVENIDNIIDKAYNVIAYRKYDSTVSSAIYFAEQLNISMIKNCKLKYTIVVDISSESYTIIDAETNKKRKFLLPLKALKKSFEMYAIKRGKNKYYYFSFENSCLRHIVDNFNR